MAKSESPDRVNDYFLVPPCEKSPNYRVGYYDAPAGQTRYVSTRTSDYEAAGKFLAEFSLEHGKPPKLRADGKPLPTDEPLVATLKRYHLQVAKGTPSEELLVTCVMPLTLTYFGEDAMLSVLKSAKKQKDFITWMRDERGLADSTIQRYVTPIFAAIAHAVEEEELDGAHGIERISQKKWEPVFGQRDTLVTLEEVAKLFNAAAERGEHCWRFMVCQIGSAARIGAILEMVAETIKFQYHIMDVNPPGRKQTTKYRPIIPLAPTFERWLRKWDVGKGPIITYKGKPLRTEEFFENLAAEAGVPHITAHLLRHFVITWLAGKGVSEWERGQFSGHEKPENRVKKLYTHYEPTYLRNAAVAIEQLFEALYLLVKRDLLLREIPAEHEQPLPEDVPQWPVWKVWTLQGEERIIAGMVGASGIEPPATAMSRRCSTTELRAHPESTLQERCADTGEFLEIQHLGVPDHNHVKEDGSE